MIARAAWTLLGLNPDCDASAVRQAYADRLRAMDPDADTAGFTKLRSARDAALADLRRRAAGATAAEPPVNGDRQNAEPVAPSPRPAPNLAIVDRDKGLAERSHRAALQQVLDATAPTEPLDDAATRCALEHLSALLATASAASIEHSRQVEDWIAAQLDRAWPRSAPLFAQVAASFDWGKVQGQIGERRVIARLNARLAGIRFVETIERPDHRFHLAWVAFSTPGVGFGDVTRADMDELLAYLREHYPEVEDLLDPLDVAAWEDAIHYKRFSKRQKYQFAMLVLLVLVTLPLVLLYLA